MSRSETTSDRPAWLALAWVSVVGVLYAAAIVAEKTPWLLPWLNPGR